MTAEREDALEKVRAYARRTARELGRAGKNGRQVVQVVRTPHTTKRTEGLFRKRVITDTTYTTQTTELFTGWLLWHLDATICEFHTDHVHEGWTHVIEVWLTTGGDLAYLRAKRRRWSSGSAPNPEDEVESVEIPAQGSAITAADINYSDARPPKTPRRPNGLYESQARWRPSSKPTPPGLRISQRLTELRKTSGTYVERNRGR